MNTSNDDLRIENEQLKRRIAQLEAARIAYASEFQLNEDGDPDVGNIHANIRALKASNTPPLTVWYGPMPESNGKSNFTAILMRKGGSITDGITIDRSEYPDRVRYEADRIRYLIGEITQSPFILDYDADLHSGYAAKKSHVSQPICIGFDCTCNGHCPVKFK